MVQWLGLCTQNTGGPGFNPGQGTIIDPTSCNCKFA